MSTIGMLVLLLAALLLLPSCTGDDVACGEGTHEEDGRCVVTSPITCSTGTMDNGAGMCVADVLGCASGTTKNDADMCVADNQCASGTMMNDAGMCVADNQCGMGTTRNMETNTCEPDITGCGGGTVRSGMQCVLADATCAEGTVRDGDTCVPDPAEEYHIIGAMEGACPEGFDGSDGDDMIQGNDEDECINGKGGHDSIKGMGGADTISGDGGRDTLHGGTGNDKLNGGDGDDTLNGDAGDDELTGGAGDNTLDGGEDVDIAVFLGALQVSVDLDRDAATVQHEAAEAADGALPVPGQDVGSGGRGTDTLMNIENVKGTHGIDVINGDENANVLKGLDGADRINGRDGNDMILPNRPAMDTDNDGTLDSNTAADDTHRFDGEDSDTADGADVVDGGEGVDTISYEGESATVTVDLGTIIEAADDVIAHVAPTVSGGVTDMIKVVLNAATEDDEDDQVSTIENVVGGFGNDTLTGDGQANTLMGGAGADTLNGAGGNDMLMGGAGADTLNGGAGADTLNGGAGNDTLAGNAGDDTYQAVQAGDTVSEEANEGMDTVHYAPPADDPGTTNTDESMNGITGTTPSQVEIVFGTQNVDALTAAATGVTILGLGGNDDLNGDAEADTLIGGEGTDALNGGAGNDVFGIFNDGTNADTIEDFTTGNTDTAITDKICLKGFTATGFRANLIPGNSTQAGVYVNNILVAIVGSTEIQASQDDGDASTTENTAVQNIVVALNKAEAVYFNNDSDPADCSSN